MARTKTLKVASVITAKIAVLENGSMVLLDEKLGAPAPTETKAKKPRKAVKTPEKPTRPVKGALGIAYYKSKSTGNFLWVAITWVGQSKKEPNKKRYGLALINKDNSAARYKVWFVNEDEVSEVTMY